MKTETQEQSVPNAFTLSQARNEKRLPANVHGDKLRGDQKMFNDFIDLLGAMNIGWTPDLVGTAGEKCVKIIVSALWYIDPYWKQFAEPGIHLLSVPSIPGIQ